jgi:ketosteroid isomerase-like protein
MSAIDDLLGDWAAAECSGDIAALDRLLTTDFAGVGPLGYVLPKPAWLARFAGGLTYSRFELEQIQLCDYGDAAVVVVRQNAAGAFGGDPLPFGAVRATLTLIRRDDRWQLAAVHMSFIAGTPGAPPLPPAAEPTTGGDFGRNHG